MRVRTEVVETAREGPAGGELERYALLEIIAHASTPTVFGIIEDGVIYPTIAARAVAVGTANEITGDKKLQCLIRVITEPR